MFNLLQAEFEDELSAAPWGEVLKAVRRCPQLSAGAAAALALHHSVTTNGPASGYVAEPVCAELSKTSWESASAGERTFGSSGAPTWDGQRLVMDIVRRNGLMIIDRPETRSPTVMLGWIFFELGLLFTGHRGPYPELGVATASAVGHDGAGDVAADSDTGITSRARFEAESITWLIAGRIGLRIAARGSLKGYLTYGELMPRVAKARVLSGVDMIEDLFGGRKRLSEIVREDVPSLFPVPTQLL